MLENGCAFVCTILSVICGILCWYAMAKGEWSCMILVSCFAGMETLFAAFALAHKLGL